MLEFVESAPLRPPSVEVVKGGTGVGQTREGHTAVTAAWIVSGRVNFFTFVDGRTARNETRCDFLAAFYHRSSKDVNCSSSSSTRDASLMVSRCIKAGAAHAHSPFTSLRYDERPLNIKVRPPHVPRALRAIDTSKCVTEIVNPREVRDVEVALHSHRPA